MDFNSLKVLHIINKYSDETDIDVIVNKSKIPKDDFVEIMMYLEKHEYIKFTHSGYVESTNKGKTYFSKIFISWIINNFLAIIAIIISIIALYN